MSGRLMLELCRLGLLCVHILGSAGSLIIQVAMKVWASTKEFLYI